MIKFAYTICYVQDVTKAIVFYETAFGFKRKFIAPEGVYGELDTGGTTLSFASIDLATSNLPDGFTESNLQNKPFAIEMGFTTDNVEAVIGAAVNAGATLIAPAKEKSWGQIVAYVRDPDGFLIEICTPMD